MERREGRHVQKKGNAGDRLDPQRGGGLPPLNRYPGPASRLNQGDARWCGRFARSFTLLETLIVIALMLVIAALALPAVAHTLAQRTFDSAVEVCVQQLLIARAHAQSTGRPVEVIYRLDPPRVEARLFDLRRSSPESDSLFDAPGADAADGSLTFDMGPDESGAIEEGWAWRKLPGGVQITRALPAEVLEHHRADSLTQLPEEITVSDSSAPRTPRPLRLAVYLPDGSALLGREVWISDASGRAVRVRVNAWTGLPQTKRLDEMLAEERSVNQRDQGTKGQRDKGTE